MHVYTQRVQTVLTAQQHALLRQLSKEQKKPVSVLVREAVERVYFKQACLAASPHCSKESSYLLNKVGQCSRGFHTSRA